jgi:hypothetical protein
VDGSRVEPRAGGANGQATRFYLVPEGGLCSGQALEGKPVDQNAVKGQPRNTDKGDGGGYFELNGSEKVAPRPSCPGIALFNYPSEISLHTFSDTLVDVYLVIAKNFETSLYVYAKQFGICKSLDECQSTLLADCISPKTDGTTHVSDSAPSKVLVWPVSSLANKVEARLKGLFDIKDPPAKDTVGIGAQASYWHWQVQPQPRLEKLELYLYDGDSAQPLGLHKSVAVKVTGEVAMTADAINKAKDKPAGKFIWWIGGGLFGLLGVVGFLRKWLGLRS